MRTAARVGTKWEVLDALVARYGDAVYGKGGFWIKDGGFVTLAKARKMVGIEAPAREFRPRVSAYGDLATVALLNGVRL